MNVVAGGTPAVPGETGPRRNGPKGKRVPRGRGSQGNGSKGKPSDLHFLSISFSTRPSTLSNFTPRIAAIVGATSTLRIRGSFTPGLIAAPQAMNVASRRGFLKWFP